MPTPIGRAWLVTPQAWRMITAVDVAILRAKAATSLFLLHFLNSAETLATCSAQASGTTRERITRRQIASLPILLPPEDVLLHFARIVAPMNEMMGKLRSLNRKLSQTLNLLLPKLISAKSASNSLKPRQSSRSYDPLSIPIPKKHWKLTRFDCSNHSGGSLPTATTRFVGRTRRWAGKRPSRSCWSGGSRPLSKS